MEKKDELEMNEVAANEERTIVEDMMSSAMKNTARLAGRKRATPRPSSSTTFRSISSQVAGPVPAVTSQMSSAPHCSQLLLTKPHAVLQNSVA